MNKFHSRCLPSQQENYSGMTAAWLSGLPISPVRNRFREDRMQDAGSSRPCFSRSMYGGVWIRDGEESTTGGNAGDAGRISSFRREVESYPWS